MSLPESVITYHLKELSFVASKYQDLVQGIVKAYKSQLKEGEEIVVSPDGLIIKAKDGSVSFRAWPSM